MRWLILAFPQEISARWTRSHWAEEWVVAEASSTSSLSLVPSQAPEKVSSKPFPTSANTQRKRQSRLTSQPLSFPITLSLLASSSRVRQHGGQKSPRDNHQCIFNPTVIRETGIGVQFLLSMCLQEGVSQGRTGLLDFRHTANLVGPATWTGSPTGRVRSVIHEVCGHCPRQDRWLSHKYP